MNRSNKCLGLLAVASFAASMIWFSQDDVVAMPVGAAVSSEELLPAAQLDGLSLVARRSPWIYPRNGRNMGRYFGRNRNYSGIYRPRHGYGGKHWGYNGKRHYWKRHYGHHHHHHNNNNNYYWPGYGIGLLWGLGSGFYYGGYGAPYYDGGYYGSGYYGAQDAHQAWCFRRYRSYDPASDTYMGYDGRRHYCRGPY